MIQDGNVDAPTYRGGGSSGYLSGWPGRATNAKRERRIYRVWEEGKAPDVVIEITSASTRLEDLGPKKGLYAVLGVREYFLFDPLAEYLRPRLRGYRLGGEEYRLVEGEPLVSGVLGLELRVEDDRLRLYRPDTGARLATPEEEASARRALEEEVTRLRGEQRA